MCHTSLHSDDLLFGKGKRRHYFLLMLPVTGLIIARDFLLFDVGMI